MDFKITECFLSKEIWADDEPLKNISALASRKQGQLLELHSVHVGLFDF